MRVGSAAASNPAPVEENNNLELSDNEENQEFVDKIQASVTVKQEVAQETENQEPVEALSPAVRDKTESDGGFYTETSPVRVSETKQKAINEESQEESQVDEMD